MTNKTTGKAIKIRRSREQWVELMAQYEASGLTQGEFCAQQSLAASTFSKWRAQLLSTGVETPQPPMFLDLGAIEETPESAGWEIELDLGCGMNLRLRRNQ